MLLGTLCTLCTLNIDHTIKFNSLHKITHQTKIAQLRLPTDHSKKNNDSFNKNLYPSKINLHDNYMSIEIKCEQNDIRKRYLRFKPN